jgi:hypothetical protein
MARIFTDGAEMGDLLFWSYVGNLTNITTNPRSGARHYQISNGSGYRNIPAVAEGYDRRGVFVTANNVAHQFFRWRKGTTELGSIRLSAATARVEIYTGTALVATSTVSLNPNTHYLIETHVKLDNSGLIEVKLDGAVIVSFSGDTTPGADTTFDNLFALTTGVMYLDDLAFNDTSGSVDNSWCGDGKIVMLPPSSAGDTTQWTPNTAVANYTTVDEVPPNTTDYNYDNTSGHADLYNTTTFTIPANNVVKRVYTEARALEETAAADTLQLGLKTNSTEYWSSNITQLTSYTRQVGTEYLVNPYTGSPWTQSEIDALQVGVKVP